MAEIKYYVALPFIATDDGAAGGSRPNAIVPLRL
jgi:hypothetical protein